MRRVIAALCLLASIDAAAAACRENCWRWTTAAFVTAAAADAYTSVNAPPWFVEENPTLPDHPTDARLVGQLVVTDILVYTAAHQARKRGYRKTANTTLWTVTVLHFAAAAYNHREQRDHE